MTQTRFDASKVKKNCNGMLSDTVYSAMYRTALMALTPLIVEVGTAHAAGTISLAHGLRERVSDGKVFTFEKIFGGSREAFGGIDENVSIIRNNIAAFGLTETIELVVGDVAESASVVPRDSEIGLLCLDADGAIDRDFRLFFDQLAIGAPIIIDDVKDRTRVKRTGRMGLSHGLIVDQKHRLTSRMLALFKSYNLIDEGDIKGSDTWFGQKVGGKFADVPTEEILNVYRSLTFTEAKLSIVPLRRVVTPVLRKALPASAVARLKLIERGD